MRTLRKINLLTLAAVLIIASGCASNHTAKTTVANTEQTRIDYIPNTHTEGFIGPESCIKPSDKAKNSWWDYAEFAFLPVTVVSGMLLWYNDLPGVGR